jgi:hypothetical protein
MNDLRQRDIANHLLGKYIAYAFNDPKKYPKEPFLYKEAAQNDKINKQMTGEQMKDFAKRFTAKFNKKDNGKG